MRRGKVLGPLIRIDRVDPTALLFAGRESLADAVGEMERLHDLASLMRSHPNYQAPDDLATRIRALITDGGYDLLR